MILDKNEVGVKVIHTILKVINQEYLLEMNGVFFVIFLFLGVFLKTIHRARNFRCFFDSDLEPPTIYGGIAEILKSKVRKLRPNSSAVRKI